MRRRNALASPKEITKAFAAFRQEWMSWNPNRVQTALDMELPCPNKKCKQSFQAIDALHLKSLSLKCPHCERPCYAYGDIRWNSRHMVCTSCSREAPTSPVEFKQTIGMLVARQSAAAYGCMCKDCISHHFKSMTGKTLLFGWFSITSLLLTPVYVVSNLSNYLGARKIAPVPPGTRKPVMDSHVRDIVSHHHDGIMRTLSGNTPPEQVAHDIAGRSDLSPAQVMMGMEELIGMHVIVQYGERLPKPKSN